MLSIYPACFFKEEKGYSVIFPDLDVATCGDTLEEAMEMAVDCLAGYLYWLMQDEEQPPVPSKMESIVPADIAKNIDFEYVDAFASLVSVDVTEYAKLHFEKSVKKTLSIPAWLNRLALEREINFSQVLQDALKEHLRGKKTTLKL